MKTRLLTWACALTLGVLAVAAPTATAAPAPDPSVAVSVAVPNDLVVRGVAEPSGAITDVGLRAAFDQGLPVVEAVRSYAHRDTTTGVIYRVVRDPARLMSPTAKFVVATGRPPAEEFLATTNLASFGTMQQLVDHYAPRVYYPGRFVATPPIQLPGAYSAAGIAFITP
ncbi:hypothetical protein [Rhodococcus ruber]|uniref:hypothetical protein n=2 Tax=Rhodococcus ruber TaxID=1830 RepID=UPI003D816251